MRLLQLIDSLDSSGGAEQAAVTLAPRLVAAGVDLHVGYLRPRHALAPALRAAGATVHPLDGRSRARAVRSTLALMRATGPDLVHTTLFEADLAGRSAAVAAGVPVVSSLVNIAYGPEQLQQPGVRWSRLRAAQAADAATAQGVRRFHALSEAVAEVMARRLLLRRVRIDVVPRGRDPQLLGERSAERRARVRTELGLTGGEPLVLAAARHEHQKGLDVLVEAVPAVLRGHPATVVAVAGRPGAATPALQRRAAELGLGDRLRLLGRRDDVYDLLAAADVVVVPSRWEGLGSTVVEAAGIGTPLVVTALAPVAEVVGDATNAVPVGDPAALAAAVLAVLRDPDAAERRAAQARARFLAHFTLDAVTASMLAFYTRALAREE